MASLGTQSLYAEKSASDAKDIVRRMVRDSTASFKNGAKLPALIAALDILHLSVMLVMKGIQLLENMGLRNFFVDKTRNDMASIPAAGKQQG